MKNVPSILLSLFMAMCLTLYGPSAMAKAQSAGSWVEICADGALQTVRIDADGIPVAPSQDCPECLVCCHSAVFQTSVTFGAATFTVLMMIDADLSMVQSPLLNKRNRLPAPRGPPATHFTQQFLQNQMQNLIEVAQANIGDTSRSDGRPSLKDANA